MGLGLSTSPDSVAPNRPGFLHLSARQIPQWESLVRRVTFFAIMVRNQPEVGDRPGANRPPTDRCLGLEPFDV